MNKIVLCLAVAVALAGCQPKEHTPSKSEATAMAQRQDASRKLTVESVELLQQKNYQGAVASLDAAIRFDPTNQLAYMILGQILLKSGEYARAVDFLDNAARSFPDNGTLFYMLSIANKMTGKKLPAVLAARRSFEIFKNSNDVSNAQKSAILLQDIINSADNNAGAAKAKK